MATPESVLKQVFGYDSFRDQQREIIEAVLAGKDSLVLMPTGGGKSICYQVPALLMEGVCIVVSPLIALMKDQVDAMRLNGIQADYLNSTLTGKQQNDVHNRLSKGEIKLLYVAPERLMAGQEFLEFLGELNVSLIAVDEAHCISQWGHDFRPEYLQLSKVRKWFKNAPIIALTATADQLTRQDILDKLKLKSPAVFISSFNRSNIQYHVQPKQQSFDRLLDFLATRKNESGIIYTLSRKQTEQLSDKLNENGFTALAYHAGLPREVRTKNQEAFLKDDVNIVVATIAFGMGIDKSNVRFVVHMNMPKNVEGYYQETGRAGRDGLDSTALLFYSAGDLFQLKQFAMVDGNEDQTRVMLKKLDEMASYCELRSCRRKYLLNYFDEQAPETCDGCDNCLGGPVKEMDATKEAQMALSAVYRLRQNRGVSYVIQFLCGAQTKIMREEDTWLPTYGVGKEHSQKAWRQFLKEFLYEGILEVSEGMYPVLKFTESSREVLSGNRKVMIPQFDTQAKPAAKAKSKSRTGAKIQTERPELFEELRVLRKRLADEAGVPAFMVFSDASLVDMCERMPQSTSDFLNVSGVGKAKLEQYGEVFLTAINKDN